jgi:hypothetical protein
VKRGESSFSLMPDDNLHQSNVNHEQSVERRRNLRPSVLAGCQHNTRTLIMLKSYIAETDREGLTENGIYLAEALAATEANDLDTSWEWMATAELTPASLMSCKVNLGAEFIRQKGFNTVPADRVYGPGWLDEP